jgi:hypothetical protein
MARIRRPHRWPCAGFVALGLPSVPVTRLRAWTGGYYQARLFDKTLPNFKKNYH